MDFAHFLLICLRVTLAEERLIMSRIHEWKTTHTDDELRRAVYSVVFNVLVVAEGYNNVGDILHELT